MSYLDEHRDEIFRKYPDEDLLRDVSNFKNGGSRLTKVINQFFEECIFNCKDNRCKLTPMEALQNDEVMAKIIGAFARSPKLYHGTEVQNVKKSLSVSGIGARKVANFDPKNARSIYTRYHKDITGLNILDTSCGFGSRMLATLLCGANYYGFDPNEELYGKLKECFEWLVKNNQVSPSQVCDLHCCGSEIFVPELVGNMDISFTSPPYFNHESYASDSGMSTTNYNNYDGWLYEFAVPTILNTYKYLKVGGIAMINVKNMVSRSKKPLYDDFMRIFQTIHGFEYIETFSMEIKHRTLHKSMNYVGFQEPVMAYKKVSEENNDPDEIIRLLKNGVNGVIQMEKKELPKELHITSVWRTDEKPTPAPKVEVLEQKTQQDEFLVVDKLDEIDPRTFGQLIGKMKSDKKPIQVVHGKPTENDIVVKLCKALDVKWKPLYDDSGFIYPEHVVRKRMTRCKPGETPVFKE